MFRAASGCRVVVGLLPMLVIVLSSTVCVSYTRNLKIILFHKHIEVLFLMLYFYLFSYLFITFLPYLLLYTVLLSCQTIIYIIDIAH